MTADLSAARDRLAKFTFEHPAWKYTDDVNGYVVTLLAALDQAAEALKPFKEAFERHLASKDAARFSFPLSDEYPVQVGRGYLSRAADVYATLKPEE